MKNTLSTDILTNKKISYDKERVFKTSGESFVEVTYEDDSRLIINCDRIANFGCEENNTCDNKDVFNGPTPYFGFTEQEQIDNLELKNSDEFNYKEGYYLLKNSAELLIERNKTLEKDIADSKLLILEYALELEKYDGNYTDDDVRLKLLRDKNVSLEEENKELRIQNESLLKQHELILRELNDCKILKDRIVELEEMLSKKRKCNFDNSLNYVITRTDIF